jgi:hypothetical protein
MIASVFFYYATKVSWWIKRRNSFKDVPEKAEFAPPTV